MEHGIVEDKQSKNPRHHQEGFLEKTHNEAQQESKLEAEEKRLHTGCAALERILIRYVVFTTFLYVLWRVTEVTFQIHT